jgi:hypothetical protein
MKLSELIKDLVKLQGQFANDPEVAMSHNGSETCGFAWDTGKAWENPENCSRGVTGERFSYVGKESWDEVVMIECDW